jgi:hypothetical protein
MPKGKGGLKFLQVKWERRREQPTSLFLKKTVNCKVEGGELRDVTKLQR